jgi:hypothetical protein
MKKPIMCLMLLPCIECCQSNNHSVEAVKQEVIHPPPPPPLDINELPDAIDKVEEAKFYPGFGLARFFDKQQKEKNDNRRGYKFNSFFYDEDKLAAIKDTNAALFEYSILSNPLFYKKGKLDDKMVDDEWQEVILFQLPHKKSFRYVDKELLKIKLCAVRSSMGVLESGNENYFIQKGYIEGKQINDSVYDVQIEARYRAVMPDTSYWVPVWVDARFKRQRKFSEPWEYRYPLFKQVNK